MDSKLLDDDLLDNLIADSPLLMTSERVDSESLLNEDGLDKNMNSPVRDESPLRQAARAYRFDIKPIVSLDQ